MADAPKTQPNPATGTPPIVPAASPPTEHGKPAEPRKV